MHGSYFYTDPTVHYIYGSYMLYYIDPKCSISTLCMVPTCCIILILQCSISIYDSYLMYYTDPTVQYIYVSYLLYYIQILQNVNHVLTKELL